jgi:ubiquinone/menaquinone biosynthesis C-methylase UbiE
MTGYLNTNFDLNSDNLIELMDEVPLWSAPFGLRLLENINYRINISALDIGFGAGFPLTEIAMRLGDSCKVYGIDPWETATKRTEKKLGFYGIRNVEIIRGVAEDIPLDNDSVDLITSNNGINNVSDLNKTLSECSRIIKKDGQFIQTMNLNNSMIEFYSIMEKVLKNVGMENELVNMEKHIYEKRKPLKEFTTMIKKHGFIVDSVIHDQFDYKFVDGTTMLNHYFIRLAFLDGWKSIIPIDRQREIFKQIEKLMNQEADINGYFTLTIPFVLIDCKKL